MENYNLMVANSVLQNRIFVRFSICFLRFKGILGLKAARKNAKKLQERSYD